MSRVEIKRQLYRNIVAGVPQANKPLLASYPDAARWAANFKNLDTVLLKPRLADGRRLNNFCVGSDPEFVFTADGRHKMAAYGRGGAGLFVGLAAGADQNERLAELRPWPSQSVVEHLASILSTLRWMYRVYPTTQAVEWRAPAFFDGDGIGGHVHFGRKSHTQEQEIAALNSLALMFAALGVFPVEQWNRRMRGDTIGQLYGTFGDVRPQAHGYEYRTMPSWLFSPDAAFVVLTASKLAMFDPEMVIPWYRTHEEARDHLLYLAKYYRSRDDDALILYNILSSRMERIVFSPNDFRPAWGIPTQPTLLRTDVTGYILPSSIKALDTEVEEMHQYLVEGKALEFREVAPNFTHSIPRRYVWAPSMYQPQRRAGAGDLIHNLVACEALPPTLQFYGNGDPLYVSREWMPHWSEAEKKVVAAAGAIVNADMGGYGIGIPQRWRQNPGIKDARKFLLGGLFPLWTVDTVTVDSFGVWTAAHDTREVKLKKKKSQPEVSTFVRRL